MIRRMTVGLGLSVVLLAGCEQAPRIDPATFEGGTLRVAHGVEGAEDIFLFVNPDGTLAGAGGGASEVSGFEARASGIRFSAELGEAERPVALDLAAAEFGPDFAGEARLADCTADCTRAATAWWARGYDRVRLPR